MISRVKWAHVGLLLIVVSLVALAGCGGANAGPFKTEVSSTQTYGSDGFLQNKYVYVNLTLEGSPETWPESSVLGTTVRGYQLKIAREDGNLQPATVLYESEMLGWTTTESWIVSKSEFANDQRETERIVLGEPDELRPGTEFTIYVYNPESTETFEAGSVTYQPEQ